MTRREWLELAGWGAWLGAFGFVLLGSWWLK